MNEIRIAGTKLGPGTLDMKLSRGAPGAGLLPAIALGVLALALALGQVYAQPPKDSVDRDYAAELPRIQPTEPGEALKTIQVAPGFRVEQVAAEPLVNSPVAVAFDEN